MRSDRGQKAGLPLTLAAAGGIAFLHLPILLIFVYAFTTEEKSFQWPPPGFTTQWFAVAWNRPDVWDALVLSLKVASIATAIALVLGTLAAAAVARTQFFGREAISLLVILPIAGRIFCVWFNRAYLEKYFFAGKEIICYGKVENDENDATSLIFDQLFVISKNDFQPIPHLAESWDNPDPLTWVFHIRKGTMFHDDNAVFPKGKSREVVADDVVYSINRMIKLSTSFVLGPIKSVKALDRYTVEIKTETPQPFLVNDSNRLARMSVVPKEAIDKLGEDGFAKTPIGSGPFKFKNFSPDSGLVIVRNDLYWLPIYLDAVEFVTIPDPAVQTLALQSGEVHVVKHLFNLEVAQTFEKNKNFQLLSRGGSYRGLGFNVSVAPYDNFEVRDAISKILDVDAAFKAVIVSHGERAYVQCPPWVPHGYDPSLKSIWSYDPAAGLKLLEKNGFKDVNNDGFLEWNGKPFKVEIKTLAGSQVKVLTIFATQLREKGLNASVLQQDTAVWADDLVQGKTGLFFDYSFAGTTGFHSLFHSSMIGKSNTHYYKNAEVDKLLDEALTKTKFSELSALWKKAQKIVFEQRVGIPMYFEWSYTIASTKVNDLVPPWGGFNLVTIENNVWLSK